jgi:hypothetical protein
MLAFGIVVLSIILVALASAIAIIFATDSGRPEMARLVFASVLPLLGTWVGTVLAYYFVRDNLTAAAKATQDTVQAAAETTLRTAESTATIVRGLPPTTPVKEAMIPEAEIDSIKASPGQDPDDIPLIDVHNMLESKKRRRVPMLDEEGAVRYVIHDSTLAQFAHDQGAQPSTLTQTIRDLAQAAELGSLIQAIAFVAASATVADARTSLAAVPGSNDVFVTEKGQRDEPMVGWLTNSDLAKFQ